MIVIQEILNECLEWVRFCSRDREYSSDQKSLTHGAYFPMNRNKSGCHKIRIMANGTINSTGKNKAGKKGRLLRRNVALLNKGVLEGLIEKRTCMQMCTGSKGDVEEYSRIEAANEEVLAQECV